MPLQPTKKLIGSWSFHVVSERTEPEDRLLTMVVAVRRSTQVLLDAELMIEAFLRCAGWLTWSGQIPSLEDVGDLTINIHNQDSSQLLKLIRSHAEAHGAVRAQPSNCEANGDGLLYTSEGSELHHLVGLRSVDDGVGATLTLDTYTTAWLGNAQRGFNESELIRLNSSRLGAALSRLAEVLETEVDPQPPTRFAIPTEVGLDIHRDADGDILDFTSDGP